MNNFNMKISGIRFRKSDKNLSMAAKLEIIKRRLTNTAANRIRAGDDPMDLGKWPGKRKAIDLKILYIPKKVKLPAKQIIMVKAGTYKNLGFAQKQLAIRSVFLKTDPQKL